MSRSSIGARLAGVGTATLLVAGLLAQAAPALAATPSAGHASPFRSGSQQSIVHSGSRGTINVRALLAHPAASLPFNPAAVSSTLGRLESKARATRSAAPKSGVRPRVAVPPPPNLATDSGAPAATTPVAVAGQSEVGGVEPAGAGIAVGPDESIQSDNLNLRFSDRLGNQLGSTTMPVFFQLLEPPVIPFTYFDSDPRIHFDTLHQRWIATEVSWDCFTAFTGNTAAHGHGYLDYAISNTADALGTWTQSYHWWNDFVPDQPNFGTSTDKLALTASVFAMGPGGGDNNPGCASGAFDHSQPIIMDWSQLVPGFDGTKVKWEYALYPDLDALRPVVQEPATSPDLRMIGAANGTALGEPAGDIVYIDLFGSAVHVTVNAVVFDLTADLVIAPFVDPPSPRQPGGSGFLTTLIDGSPDSAIFKAGTLAFTSTYPCTPTGDTIVRDCVRVVTLGNASPTLEPTRIGDTLLGTNGFDESFGGIAWSGSGLLDAVYSRSSATSDASSYAQYNLPTDTPIQWSAQQQLTAGAAHYAGTQWGNYLIVASDPQDPNAVWVGDPYAAADGTWATKIHELVVGGAGAGYFPLAPIRVLDSRSPSGAPVGFSGALSANSPRTFPVTGVTINSEMVPTGAVAITGNLTVTGQTAAGFLALTPTPTVTPASSTLNFPLGDTRANNVTIALAPDGSLAAVYKAVAGKHANVILDVTGYFLAGSGQTYFPLSPVRILDSRFGTGAPTFVANIAQTFAVRSTLTIPADATAVTANLTITGQTKPGYVALTPLPTASPSTSTINFPLGDNRANGLTIPINPVDGTVSAVYKAASGTANLILDVTGYYSMIGGGLLFHPLNPGRRVDTRQPLGFSGFGNGLSGAQGLTPRIVPITDHFGVPASAAAITGNLTITAQTGPGFVAVTDASIASPTTSTINFPLGDTRANGITAPLGSGDLWFVYQPRVGKTVHLILDITGFFQ
jgi:hypothetical protein